jgi:hypothetical protein
VRTLVQAHLATMQAERTAAGPLGAVADHITKVTASYGKGLYYCYDIPDLPRTNNDLERCFGAVRYHERRATGRRSVTGGTIVRGAVRLTTVLATREGRVPAVDVRLNDRMAWQHLRQRLNDRRDTRRAQRRFRRDPTAYVTRLEQLLLE